MSEGRIFGTDGIRGRAGEGWLTPEAVAALGRATGAVLRESGSAVTPRALVGNDGRRSGPALENALARGLAASGFEVASAGLITTPGLAWLTRNRDFGIGIMVSASHNPAEDNGIKVFAAEGDKLSDELEIAIEERLRDDPSAELVGPATEVDASLEMAYLRHLVEDAAPHLKLDGASIVLDCANGGASRVAPRVLGRLGAQLATIAAEPDGENINRECGSTHPERLQHEVRARGARLGIALDGDGDRCLLVDERGELVHGDGIMTLIARHAMQRGDYSDPRIVATVMSNRGLHRALREVGVSVVEVGVGDRQVVDCLRRESLRLGGEQSGHIVLGAENHYIGDGIFTALRVLLVMQETGATLSRLAAPFQALPQVLLNVPVASKPNLEELDGVAETVRRAEEELGQDGRVLLRYSGTEPLARVMVEGPDPQRIQALARAVAERIEDHIGARPRQA